MKRLSPSLGAILVQQLAAVFSARSGVLDLRTAIDAEIRKQNIYLGVNSGKDRNSGKGSINYPLFNNSIYTNGTKTPTQTKEMARRRRQIERGIIPMNLVHSVS